MSDFVILSLILFLLVCLVLTVVALVVYTGLLSEVVVRTGSPPIKKITIAYKLHKGSYKDSGAAFTESCSIAPKLSCIALYYDDPNQTQADSCRYAVGSVLSENEETPDEELQRLYEKFGFHIISFPEVSCAVMSSFPNRCSISPFCGAYRVFPELNAYIAERRLTAYPYMEICKGDVIHYMCPLENQESFFVPELREKQIADEKDTKDDKDTDVKETDDSCKSESSAAVVKAEAESCDMETSPVVQQQSEEDGQTEEGDQGSKGSSESVGSGSSFEELDMDLEEAEKQREAGEECHVDDNEKRTDNDG